MLSNNVQTQVVGPQFSLPLMQHAQQLALEALECIATKLVVGMSEADAIELAKAELLTRGAEVHWHPPIVRFGANTSKIFSESSDPSVRLQQSDICFIDLGPVFANHEADVGATFVIGDLPAHRRIQQACEHIFHQVARHWREANCSGDALYRFAEQQALAHGMRLNHQIKGHRVGDFPHRLYASGQLGQYTGAIDTGIWVLEIQIVDPELGLGAFMEQVLF